MESTARTAVSAAANKHLITGNAFLADRTNGRAYGMDVSSVRLSVCNVMNCD